MAIDSRRVPDRGPAPADPRAAHAVGTVTSADPHWHLPYPSRRMPVLAANVVATSQPLAAQAGLSMLANAGNAVDAAVAAAIALTVVEPTSNGIGGDAFALVWHGRTLHALNGSGRSPRSWTPERFAHLERMPLRGWESVTVPGCVDAWATLSDRFGALPFGELFGPAISYARDGFLVSPITADRWRAAQDAFGGEEAFAATFLPGGRAPRAGERFRCPDQVATLRAIAESRGAAFYRGEIAERIVRDARDHGAALDTTDLAEHRSEWVDPIDTTYADLRVHEIPPNGQGLAALIALGTLAHVDLGSHPVDGADSVHVQIEAMKLALSDAADHVADASAMRVSVDELLDAKRLAARAASIRLDRASPPPDPVPTDHGTVYLTAADSGGMMVSFIQSNFWGFGSGVVVPGTGVSLQNRGSGFVLTPGHVNEVRGGKRPFHTIIPGFVTRDGAPILSFGVMGGHMQTQGHVQMVVRRFTYGQNVQAASDAPRWFVRESGAIALEPALRESIGGDLAARGHEVEDDPPEWVFGGAQLAERVDGGYVAASDHRKDGCAIGF